MSNQRVRSALTPQLRTVCRPGSRRLELFSVLSRHQAHRWRIGKTLLHNKFSALKKNSIEAVTLGLKGPLFASQSDLRTSPWLLSGTL